jgi:hypothetical protein
MEWIMFDAMYRLLHDTPAEPASTTAPSAEPSEQSASSESPVSPAFSASSPASPSPADAEPYDSDPYESEPYESDLWIVRQMYGFIARRTVCCNCGANLGRKVTLAVDAGAPAAPWRIDVGARCRGLRRHRHTAEITEAQGGLRFGELLPVSA